MVERVVWDHQAAGSLPVTSTKCGWPSVSIAGSLRGSPFRMFAGIVQGQRQQT
jgi:hypothetical protein